MTSPFFVRHGLNVNNFLVVNSTTVAIGANVVSNNTTQLVGNSTVRSIISASSTQVANSTINVTIGPGSVSVGANNIANSTTNFIGNSTVNSTMSSLNFQISNSTVNVSITPATISVGANNIANSTAQFIGNSTVNTIFTSNDIKVSNSTSNVIVGPASISVGANLFMNLSAYSVGNSTSNIAITGVNIKFPDASVQNSAAFGKTMIWLPAGSWKSRTNAGATANTYQSVTNLVDLDVFDFSSTVNNSIQFCGQLPKSWNGNTFTYQTVWLMPNTTVNFGTVWSMAATSIANNGSSDPAFGTAINVTSTGAVNNAIYISPESANVTIGNSPGADPLVVFQLTRLPGDAADTLAVPAKFIGTRIWFTSNKVNDA